MNNHKTKSNGKSVTSLPFSGLAEDVLPPAENGLNATASLTISDATPEPIYEFADSLQNTEVRKEASEERPETWVSFTLGGEIFSLPVSHVREILRVSSITRVPHAPESVRGVTNMRGRVLPVVDLRIRLGLASADVTDHSRILVVSSQGRLIGLLVDSVDQVIRILRTGIQQAPADVMTEKSDYIRGVYHLTNNLAILLDVDRVLSNNGTGQIQ
jgi:purine-binding chemotaxis protein CheW